MTEETRIIMKTVSINKHLKLRIMRGRAVEGLTVRDIDTSPLTVNRSLWHQYTCRCVHYTGVLDISTHICEHTLRRVCACARVCVVCSLALGDEGGEVKLVYEGTCCWRGGIFLTEGKIGMLSVFS